MQTRSVGLIRGDFADFDVARASPGSLCRAVRPASTAAVYTSVDEFQWSMHDQSEKRDLQI
jgi:hypothetical protein